MAFQRTRSPFADDAPEALGPLPSEAQPVGEVLRRQRQSHSLELGEAAAALKIKPSYLIAIEEGRPQDLPGPAYAVGFVRSYSDYLGLDSTEFVRRFKRETAGLAPKPELTFPLPLGERSLPTGKLLLTGLILTVCVYGGWYHFARDQRAGPGEVAEVPAELAPAASGSSQATAIASETTWNGRAPPMAPEPLPKKMDDRAGRVAVTAAAPPAGSSGLSAPGEAKSGETIAAASGPSALAPAAASLGSPAPAKAADMPRVPEPSAPAARAVPLMATAAATGSAAAPAAAGSSPAPPADKTASPVHAPSPAAPNVLAAPSPTAALNESEARVYGAPGQGRITVRAKANSWVQIRTANRVILFTGVLKTGDTFVVPDQPGLTMRVGNAGGLDIVVDGKPAPAIGPVGAVRNVALDPGTLIAQGAAHD